MPNNLMLLLTSLTIAMVGSGIWVTTKDIRHPALLYTAVWVIILCLCSLPVIRYPETSALTLIIISLSALTFSLASLIGSAIPWGFHKDSVTQEQAGKYLPSTVFLSLLVVIGIFAGLYYYQSKFGLATLLSNPGYVRYTDRDGSGFYGFLLLLPSFSIIALALRWLLTRKNSWGTASVMIFAYTYFAVLPERTTVIANTLWIVGMWVILDKRFQRKILKYVLFTLVGFSVLLTFFIIVNDRTGKNVFFDTIGYAIKYENLPTPFISPYIYVTGSIPALSTLISDPDTSDFGYKLDRTMFPFARVIQLISQSQESKLSESEDAAFIPFYFNTYTWLSLPIRDQGVIGSQLYVFLVGLLAGLIYRAAKATRKPLWTFLYGGVFSAILLSGMTNRFSSLTWWVAAAFALIILASPQMGWKIRGIRFLRFPINSLHLKAQKIIKLSKNNLNKSH